MILPGPKGPPVSSRVDVSASTPTGTPIAEQTLGQLVATASKDLSVLVHKEIELAKAELSVQVKHAGIGAGLLGGAGFLGIFALAFLSTALAFGLAGLGLPLGIGFLIVGVLYLLGAGIFALIGKRNLSKVGPPERTVQTVKDDLAWVKHPTQVPAAQGALTGRR